jgi:hypothetical protein
MLFFPKAPYERHLGSNYCNDIPQQAPSERDIFWYKINLSPRWGFWRHGFIDQPTKMSAR